MHVMMYRIAVRAQLFLGFFIISQVLMYFNYPYYGYPLYHSLSSLYVLHLGSFS